MEGPAKKLKVSHASVEKRQKGAKKESRDKRDVKEAKKAKEEVPRLSKKSKKALAAIPEPAPVVESESEPEPEEEEKPKATAPQDPTEQSPDSADSDPESTNEDEANAEKPAEKAEPEEPKTFADLGVMESLCTACETLNYKSPTPIQALSIPAALSGKDLIALAETGSGKTAAFALPILQSLWNNPIGLFACILAPTRELAYQISDQFEALGGGIGVRCAVIVGGMDMMTQSVALGKKPHIVVATPGRLLDHLENTKGFSLRTLKYLVMDEADRLLDMDFGPILDKILKVIPKMRNTYLFSATMTSKVEKLQRASLNAPVRVEVGSKYSTVSTLIQRFLFIPFKHKDTYLVYLMNELAGQTIIIFARTVLETNRIAILLRFLGFKAVPLNGQMSQSARLGALNKFKSGSRNILVATDVAARGLDIPSVDAVINHDLAQDSKTYIHRVGRTARAGRSGRSISLVTQYDVELFLRIEAALGKKIDQYECEEENVLVFSERVGEAQREAAKVMREEKEKKGNGRGEGRSGGRGGRGGAAGGKRRRDDMDRGEE
ncbi:DEAD-domain-containing protein [Morchella conica CCBAS932]|uniref:ATP-dependent rRNA helicase RRP3 n=1 Tax=Morchella conica CCBAS932 TaxID=1392247 RepID=A0A3N4KT62_9PEZI|nr:DEAD-domain-containing protein [Morchella conica CCBAS932]